jgi:hypothetical protein
LSVCINADQAVPKRRDRDQLDLRQSHRELVDRLFDFSDERIRVEFREVLLTRRRVMSAYPRFRNLVPCFVK